MTTDSSAALALLGFNLGFEAGQLVIAMALLPLAYALRGAVFYQGIIRKGGSGLIAISGGLWLAKKLFDT
jgi:hypothetical protein